MADVALVVIAVDGLWGRLGLVPENDRTQVLRAATAGIHFALQTRGDGASLRPICRMLRLDPIPICGRGLHTERNGRIVCDAATGPEPVFDALVDELAAGHDPFGRANILAIGSLADEAPLLRAAGIGAAVGSELSADHVAQPLGTADSGVGRIVGELVLRNNRFLRPPVAERRFLVL